MSLSAGNDIQRQPLAGSSQRFAAWMRIGGPQVDDPNRIVVSGYNRIAKLYEVWASSNAAGTYYRQFLDRCLDLIPQDGRVLDLGCGAGRVATEMAGRARVVGVHLARADSTFSGKGSVRCVLGRRHGQAGVPLRLL